MRSGEVWPRAPPPACGGRQARACGCAARCRCRSGPTSLINGEMSIPVPPYSDTAVVAVLSLPPLPPLPPLLPVLFPFLVVFICVVVWASGRLSCFAQSRLRRLCPALRAAGFHPDARARLQRQDCRAAPGSPPGGAGLQGRPGVTPCRVCSCSSHRWHSLIGPYAAAFVAPSPACPQG